MKARRSALETVGKRADTHAGLWMDKFLSQQTEKGEAGPEADSAKGAKSALLDEVASLSVPALYDRAHARRLDALKAASSGGREVIVATAVALGRTVVGLGQKGPTEIGICLEHTWGVPMLPGSSLKGVAASAAHLLHGGDEWGKAVDDSGKPIAREPNSYDWLFGTNDERGAVSFLDAWFVAGSKERPLDLDVMTVHHPLYYSGTENKSVKDTYPPSDMDSPNPVSFLTTSGSFSVVLEGEKAWVETAFKLLSEGLAQLGIGAKTNAGYGRFKLERVKSRDEILREQAEEKQRERDAELARKWAGLEALLREYRGAANATDIFKRLVEASKQGCPDVRLKEIAKQLNAQDKKAWKEWSKKDKRTPEEKEYFARLFTP